MFYENYTCNYDSSFNYPYSDQSPFAFPKAKHCRVNYYMHCSITCYRSSENHYKGACIIKFTNYHYNMYNMYFC